MDLIDKINKVFVENGFRTEHIDLHYDVQNNVYGFISDESFISKDRKEIQKEFWSILKKNLDPSELLSVHSIYSETPEERSLRYFKAKSKIERNSSRIWYHQTPDVTIYWIFVDVVKLGDTYKSFFLVLNEKYEYKKGIIFNYEKDVLAFMELADEKEIYHELHINALSNAENEVKLDLMERYEKLSTAESVWGKDNRYHYVFDNFDLTPATIQQIVFTENEINLLKINQELISVFPIADYIAAAISKSELINSKKNSFNF